MTHVPQVGAAQLRFDDVATRAGVNDAFHHREVSQQSLGGHTWMEAEGLRQVAERLAQPLFVADDIDVAERDRPGIGFLQSRDRAHERLARVGE